MQVGSVLGGPMTQPMVGMHTMDSNAQMYAQSSTLAYFDTIGQPLPGGAINHPTANRAMTSHGHGMGQPMYVGGLHANNLGMQMLPRVQLDNCAPAPAQPGGDFPQIMPSTLPPPASAPAEVPECQLDFFPSTAEGANRIGLLASHNYGGMPVADMVFVLGSYFGRSFFGWVCAIRPTCLPTLRARLSARVAGMHWLVCTGMLIRQRVLLFAPPRASDLPN